MRTKKIIKRGTQYVVLITSCCYNGQTKEAAVGESDCTNKKGIGVRISEEKAQ